MAELEREQESPGNDLENIRRFFHSAERMYKMEGWKRIHEKDESAISVFFCRTETDREVLAHTSCRSDLLTVK